LFGPFDPKDRAARAAVARTITGASTYGDGLWGAAVKAA
jgi:hypothetical protein